MKKLLRSFVVMALALAVAMPSTMAYFTANASATNNQIITGTMIMYVGTYATPTGDRTGQWVVYADKDGNHQIGNFEPITNVEPGVTRSTYAVVENNGSLDFRYRATAGGDWVNPALDGMMNVTNVHRYAVDNCEGDAYCEDIYYWLIDNGKTNVSAGALDLVPSPYIGGDSADYQLAQNQFTVYRVDLQLDPAAGNEFQGETYLYTLSVDAKQVSAPSF